MGALRIVVSSITVALMISAMARADSKKAAQDQRLELIRGLTAEFATVKAYLPRSKKPLQFDASGTWDKEKWQEAGNQFGPAARIGDLIQVTHVDVKRDSIILELNNGLKSQNGHWYDHVQIGMGQSTTPIGSRQSTAQGGTVIEIYFSDGTESVTSSQVKKLLTPVLDFEKHSVTEQYLTQLPPEIKQAVQEKRAIKGMDRDAVLMALGHPNRKTRETKDGQELEDWIYGEPPGRVTFVTFSGAKVIQVKEAYADLGGSVAATPTQP